MNANDTQTILEQSNLRLRTGWWIVLWVLCFVGFGQFAYGLFFGQAERAWQAFLINAVFWAGMAQAGVLFSAIWQITDARWGSPYKRVAESFGAFLPWGYLALLCVAFGAGSLYEWAHHPMPAKAGYLNLPFFVVRNLLGLGLLLWLSRRYLRNAIRPDLALARTYAAEWGGNYATRMLRGFDAQQDPHGQRARRLAPLLALVHAFVFTMIAFDYLMSLDQEWFSTLFGVFVIVGHLYSALAMLMILAAWLRRNPVFAEYITINRYHDLSKLTFAIAMLYAYMAFTQYLVIWYSNLPEETPYLITRSIADTPWKPLFWSLFGVLFVFPFLALMPRTICRRPKLGAPIAFVLLIGQWWANYLLVVPSIQDRHPNPQFLLNHYEIWISLGFGAAFFLAFFSMLGRCPVLPIADSRLCRSWHGH